MKIIARSFIFLIVSICAVATLPSVGVAGDQYSCVVSGVGAFSGNNGWYLQCDGGDRTGKPSCVGSPNQWGKLWTDANSKEIYALAITFWMSGKPVRLNGTGECNPSFAGRETLNGLERIGM